MPDAATGGILPFGAAPFPLEMSTNQIALRCTSAAVSAWSILRDPDPDCVIGCSTGPESVTVIGEPCDETLTEIGPGCVTTNANPRFSP